MKSGLKVPDSTGIPNTVLGNNLYRDEKRTESPPHAVYAGEGFGNNLYRDEKRTERILANQFHASF